MNKNSYYRGSGQRQLRIERNYPIIMEINMGQWVSIDLNAINEVVDCVLISYSSGRMRGLHKSYLPYGVLRFKTTEDMFIAKLML